ncbi:hypothetical protein C8U37_10542 [Trichococcus patagoniensis]|uniref:Uncharacterized protein n=1 Tax=Trichococcus patagoniensis TaxID=382641 RepID=A0A2T5IMU7_9LACT|nr:hypothetical protein C8U37_10542 [Trichococcus patagoniensis]
MIITSDHGGFAGVRPSATQSPPASMRSTELGCLAQVCFPARRTFIGAGVFLR